MSEIRKFTGPYSSTAIATYEPLFVKWYGISSWRQIQDVLARRIVAPIHGRDGLEVAPFWDRVWWGPKRTAASQDATTLGSVGHPPAEAAAVAAGWDTRALQEHRRSVEALFNEALTEPATLAARILGAGIPFLVPRRFQDVEGLFRLALSPLGILHMYRQLYFDEEVGVGPLEQAFSVAPNETVEIIQESSTRRVFEKIEEFGTETSVESEAEERTQDDISDQVDSSVKRDRNVAISADANVNFPVWSLGASLNVDLELSVERSRQQISKQMSSKTRRVAETFRKSYSLKLKTITEISERNTLRRVIENKTDTPVNYGLRRLMRKMRVRIQSLGPRLCWQLYVTNPGLGLAQPRFVLFRESDPISIPGVPAGAPPPPRGGEASGSQVLGKPPGGQPTEMMVYSDYTKKITGLVINSVLDVSPEGGKDAPVDPSATGVVSPVSVSNLPAGAAKFQMQIDWQKAEAVEVHYTYYYEPSEKALEEWNNQVRDLRKTLQTQQLEEQFEKAKGEITARSKVRVRPPADLRAEERIEILSRMIRELLGGQPAGATPAEIEFFHRYFDVSALFYYLHPSWWAPRYRSRGGTLRSANDYEITDESDPAPLGKSLGWLIQSDGDRRRNEFLNSPWVRVCIPFRPGVEREGVIWLAEHVEGKAGLEPPWPEGLIAPDSDVDGVITHFEKRRVLEGQKNASPEYLTELGEEVSGPQEAIEAYPVISEYLVVLPTEGFIYDRLVTETS